MQRSLHAKHHGYVIGPTLRNQSIRDDLVDRLVLEGEIDRLLVDFAKAAIVAYPLQSRQPAPDPGDQHLWDLLAEVPDALLVTGDAALHRSADFPGRILSPRELAERFHL